MDVLKKTGIVAGAVIGGTIGGILSVAGRITNKKIIDNVGESVVDSFIYFGSIAGGLASGAADVVVGNLREDVSQVDTGLDQIVDGGKKLVGNWIHNIKLVAGEGKHVVKGIKTKDIKQVKQGIRTMGRIAAVGAMTVGAIRLKDEDPLEEESIDTRKQSKES